MSERTREAWTRTHQRQLALSRWEDEGGASLLPRTAPHDRRTPHGPSAWVPGVFVTIASWLRRPRAVG